ncbi:MAG TPA: transposase [Syntrophales bacterium]|nr:transposase [Syntrophales bacterium]
MPRIARIIAAQYPHHITQRGNNRADVFFDENDRGFYLKTLNNLCKETRVRLWAYCLMTNHVHLLVVPEEGQHLARCIGTTNLIYTQYINRKYVRSGRLWQNRFFSTVIEAESYLWAVARYIELNPVKAHLVENPAQYRWSSCGAHVWGISNEFPSVHEWLDKMDREAYTEYLMQHDPSLEKQVRKATSTGRPLGNVDFIKTLEEKLQRRLLPGKAGRPKRHKNVK